MSSQSIVILTDTIRQIPYFSSFSKDEKEIIIPKPFINESIEILNVQELTTENILLVIENKIYLGMDTKELINELLWRMGESEEKMNNIKSLPNIIQLELNPILKSKNYEYIYSVRCRVLKNKDTCAEVSKFGNLRLLKYLRENGGDTEDLCPWDEWTCSNAALNGHLEVLKYARENNCPWNESTCRNAAYNGHLEVLKWARENNCPWDESTCRNAALNGHLEVLKYARENNCPWDESTCSSAADGGHLEVLKWARENDCPWDEWTCNYAAATKNWNVLKWALENGCPRNKGRIRNYVSKHFPELLKEISI